MPFNNSYHNKKVLITGHTGFKGSWLSLWLLKLGAKVFGISKSLVSEPSHFSLLKLDHHLDHHLLDIRNYGSLAKLIKNIKPDIIFHLAAQAIVSKSYQDPIETISTNVLGTSHILHIASKLDQAVKLIIITSDKCYDNQEWFFGYRENDQLGGKDIYSASKASAEILYKAFFNSFLQASNVLSLTVRAGNVIGGGDFSKDRIVVDIVKAWAQGKQAIVRNPQATRPWQHVLEPLSAYLLLGALLDDKINGESFNIGPKPDQDKTVLDLIQSLMYHWQNNAGYKIVTDTNFAEANLLRLNCDKTNTCLKWQANLDYEQTVAFTGAWYEQFYNQDLIFSETNISDYEAMAKFKGLVWNR